jgi:hypothetical protein
MAIKGISVLKDLVEETTSKDTDPIYTHIIDRGDDTRPAKAIVLEAMVNGTPITALCGYTWVPSRDPLRNPPCEKCVEIYEYAKDFRGV